uniref:Uncharacterized protein n=1 Tax=Physcomitrium patens TaxID=3218 RepID=A0A2K1J2P6_PHYPA|nr:protein REVERSION-TO-ETHYLENE SENSITIVITY1-like isoform X2 [Physcomitrium patens]PNR35799.1 hypothetical protein PHYPA_021649 [Physcomitrium patens]|eukprot:XP_024401639.1 protein REVERSION-TO-ETHYLENE SENSITIVITY1-like isoform X2 [Physcomitrella patens]
MSEAFHSVYLRATNELIFTCGRWRALTRPVTEIPDDAISDEGVERYDHVQVSSGPVSTSREELRSLVPPRPVVRRWNAPERPVDLKNGKFPYCLVWVPLPIIAWLVPFVGHVGICREDGVILDFAGNINVDNLAFGSCAKYVRLSPNNCCFPHPQYGHTCKVADKHAAAGMAYSWDDAISRSVQVFGRKSYNFFTCNCHSFVANCMNRMAYGGHTNWNLVDVLLLALVQGEFVDFTGFLRGYVPFVAIMTLGLFMADWVYFFFWAGFATLLLGWFIYGTYVFGGYIDC